MSFKDHAVALALAASIATPAPAFAVGGFGCSNLPEYARAVATLQGSSVCDMTVEEARRIVATQGRPATYQHAAPAPLAHHRHHRVRMSQPY